MHVCHAPACLPRPPPRYSYMIDNIVLLLTGSLHQRQIAELRAKCHPLGSFDEMESINIANTPAELYTAVMVDTPLGTGVGGWSLLLELRGFLGCPV